MKKLILAISLFGLLPLAHAEILDNVAPIGDFVSGSAGSEIVIPVWTKIGKTTVNFLDPNSGSIDLYTGETFQFRVFTYNTFNTSTPPLFALPARAFPDPSVACGLPFSKQNYRGHGDNNDTPHFTKTSGNIFAVGRNLGCQVFDASGKPVLDANGKPTELTYSYVYMADVTAKTSWMVGSKTEELVGMGVIPNQNPGINSTEELAITFMHKDLANNRIVRVLVIDPAIVGTVVDKTLSNKSYLIGNSD